MKKRIWAFVIAAMLLVSALTVGAFAQDSSGQFSAGYAMEELIAAGDTTEYVLTGSGMNTGANDPICITCIAMQDRNGKTVLLMSADFASIPLEVGQKARDAVSKATGVPRENILISATHTHSSLELNATYGITYQLKNRLYSKAVTAAQAAMEDLSPAVIRVGSVEVADADGNPMNFIRHAYRADGVAAGDNHRKEGAKSVLYGYQGMSGEYCSEVDTTMHLLAFECEGEDPIVLANWRVHATTFSAGGSSQISADFIGSFRDQMAADGYRAIYFQGASGDVNPRDIIQQVENPDSYVGPERVSYGQTLAANAKAALTGDTMQTVPAGTLRTAVASYTPAARTSFNNVPDTKTDAQVYAKAQQILDGGTNAWQDNWYESERDYGIYSVIHARAIVNQFNSDGTPKTAVCDPIEVGSFSIGNEVAFLRVPGEMFTETSVALEQACANAGYEKTFILGYTNEHVGYFPSAAAYGYGCYEADVSRYASGVAEGIQQTLTGSLQDLEKYCECGGAAEGKGRHTCEAVQWTAWTEDGALPTDAGNYKLMNDVTLSAPYTPAGEVHLDLNGHTVQKSSPRVIVVNGNDLTVTDTSPEQTGTIKLNRTAVYATGNNGGILWVQSGSFTLYGGTLDGSLVKTTHDRGGAAVNVSPGHSFIMYDGKVIGGEATSAGGAVSTLGVMELYGGTVTGGKAANGGNVAVLTASGARGLLRIYGGSVEKGTATAAGGNIAVLGAAYSETNIKQAEAYIYAGSVTDGTAFSGGNVAVLGAQAEISGGNLSDGIAASDGGNLLAEGVYDATYAKVLSATVEITDGTVTGGTASEGGNLSIRGAYTEKTNAGTIQADSAAVTMSGGSITAGKATGTYGGNVQVGSGAVLNLNGGDVTGGTTAGHGGNIAVNKYSYDANGGLTYSWAAGGSLNISGNARISQGVATKNAGNILLFGAMKMSGGIIQDGTTGSYGVNIRAEGGSNLNLSGGQIAGGVYVNNANSITLSGGVQILPSLTSEGYTANEGLRLQTAFTGSKKLKISGLTAGARVQIVMGANTGAFATLPETMPEGMNAAAYAGFFVPTNAAYSVTVDAENNTLNLASGHIHCECGGAAAGVPGHTCELVTWTAKTGWIGDNNLTEGGHYYLSGDSSGIRVGSASAAKNVHLCLNGHAMNNTADGQRTVMIYGAGSLTVCDHDGTGVITGTSKTMTEGTVIWMNDAKGSFTLYGGDLYAGEGTTGLNRGGIVGYYGTLNMYGGTITGTDLTAGGTSADNGWGGAVLVNTLNMYGGTINGGSAVNGGAVVARTELNMYGGTIFGGAADAEAGLGGALYLDGAKLNISGGTISGGSAYNGATIYAKDATVTMDGGTVIGGSAVNNGGAIMLANGSIMNLNGGSVVGGTGGVRGGAFMVNGGGTMLYVKGGKVIGGTVSGNGSAVFVNGAGQLHVTGGTIEKGNVYISGGKLFPSGGEVEEVRIHSLTYASDLTVSGAPVLKNVVLDVETSSVDTFYVKALTDGASITFDPVTSGYENGAKFASVMDSGEYAQHFVTADTLMADQAKDGLYWVDSPILAYNADGVYTETTLPVTVTEDLQLILNRDLDKDLTVNSRLSLDLNGNQLSGSITGTGSLALADSATDDFTGDYGQITGTVSVDVEDFTSFDGKTYLVVKEEDAYSAHRYSVKLTHVTLRPAADALGYKAQFKGDETVCSYVTDFGFRLWVDDNAAKTFGKGCSFENGQVLTLRLKDILASDGGERTIHGEAFITFRDVAEPATSASHSTTMKQTLQTINEAWMSYSEGQRNAVKELCDRYVITKDWELTNIYPAES